MLFTGPTLEKRAKKSIEKAAAMIKFGIYITVLKKDENLMSSRLLVNHTAKSKEIRI
jgi:hypothetical protein